MKVRYYFRDQRKGVFSIEMVFQNIIKGVNSKVETLLYYSSGNKLKDLITSAQNQGDVNHITGDTYYLAFGLRKNRTIITIHDLGHYEETLKGWKKIIYKYFWLKLPLQRAKYITTISNFTKERIIAHFKIDPNKIVVIHNPCPLNFNYTPKSFNKSKPVILQIGSGRNKNIKRLIEAVKGISCKLLLIRKPAQSLIDLLEKNKIEYEFHYHLSPDQIINKYIECDLVFFASTYEGFGVPILEANSIGRPVITSNVASMPEVSGDAACLVNPLDVLELRAAIIEIIENENYREELIKNGRKNIERFKLENICKQYLDLYNKICE